MHNNSAHDSSKPLSLCLFLDFILPRSTNVFFVDYYHTINTSYPLHSHHSSTEKQPLQLCWSIQRTLLRNLLICYIFCNIWGNIIVLTSFPKLYFKLHVYTNLFYKRNTSIASILIERRPFRHCRCNAHPDTLWPLKNLLPST